MAEPVDINLNLDYNRRTTFYLTKGEHYGRNTQKKS